MNPFKKLFSNKTKDNQVEYEFSLELDDFDTETMGIIDHNDPEFYSLRKNSPLE